jgi:hypothetical protein
VPTTVPDTTTVAETTTTLPPTTTTTSTVGPTTTTVAPPTATPITAPPSAPPVHVCGTASLHGPAGAPAGAIVVPAGDNSALFDQTGAHAGATYWLAPGVHTIAKAQYGHIVPADGQTFIGAPGAVLDGRHVNLLAFTERASNVRIAYLEIRNFGHKGSTLNEAVVNHDSGVGWVIEHDDIHDNAGAGVFVASDGVLRGNCLRSNGQYGFAATDLSGTAGAHNVVVEGNEIASNDTDDWESRIGGCGCSGGAKFWHVTGARVVGNWVHDNASVGLWADYDNADFLFEGNWIEASEAAGLMYEISYNAVIRYNTLVGNTVKEGTAHAARGDTWPLGTLYVSEAGGDSRVPGPAVIDIHDNLFVNNWSGVTVWESANRFCGYGGFTGCTLVGGATADTCVAPAINQPPLLDDCRWRSQHVHVHDNDFRIDPAAVKCAPGVCGRQALISEVGSVPAGSPYAGTSVQDAVTFSQDNVWSNNHYTGPWSFTVRSSDGNVDAATWRAAPYQQDAGSTFG